MQTAGCVSQVREEQERTTSDLRKAGKGVKSYDLRTGAAAVLTAEAGSQVHSGAACNPKSA